MIGESVFLILISTQLMVLDGTMYNWWINIDENDLSTRFQNITCRYESLNALEQAITESLILIQEVAQHHLRDIMDDLPASNRYLKNPNKDRARAFLHHGYSKTRCDRHTVVIGTLYKISPIFRTFYFLSL